MLCKCTAGLFPVETVPFYIQKWCPAKWHGYALEESSRILVEGVACTFFVGLFTHAGTLEGEMKTNLCDGM